MKLEICYLPTITMASSIADVRQNFSDLAINPIAQINWEQFNYKPEVGFKIAYTDDGILLNYLVNEKYIKACYTDINSPVYRDSCVEFFISFNGEEYYNFEFNCIGTPFAAFGTSNKTTRKPLPIDILESIQIDSLIHTTKAASSWNMFIYIPLKVLVHHSLTSLHGIRCTGNFYKCGDELPVPHFLSWNPIDAEAPNFHLPNFFGELFFVKS